MNVNLANEGILYYLIIFENLNEMKFSYGVSNQCSSKNTKQLWSLLFIKFQSYKTKNKLPYQTYNKETLAISATALDLITTRTN